ncbi:MAG: tripartite tricarboxylate transporter substrate binding protein [Synergistetes bacterium]|nr:tripartite tricarboxylate transporter substrate binding protein [Synergistota bacterium]MCX8128325.1 tripartite tricarboxylate transporter substrate binding protein [Synergistota bacterium]MDW8192644.1 tripartite tricarboxylate transporter substrate binding protein [Synergistota bacterium]
MNTKKLLALVLSITFLLASGAFAADYPTKPVTIIVPWAAGGATDVLFRAIAAVFPKYSGGHPLVVANLPGGGAVPGTMEFLRAKADGYTLLSLAAPIIIKSHMDPVQFDANSFEPVALVVNDPCYILVKKDAPWKDLKEYVEYAKQNPGKVTIGNGGAGGGTHLAALAFESFAKIKLVHVPFEGGGPAVTALVGGHINSYMGAAPEGLSNVDAGQLRILGVFGTKRLDKYPDVPTAKEQGFDFQFGMWRGVALQKGTPKEIVDKLHEIISKCIKDPEFQSKAKELSLTIDYKNPADFAKLIQDYDKYYEDLIKANKLGNKYK